MTRNIREEGGYAFPEPYDGHGGGNCGMTLRDWFAGQALAGELSCQSQQDGWVNTDEAKQDTAAKCYSMADAMLKARKMEIQNDRT